MLEGVRLDVAIGQRLVRHHIVREFDNVDLKAHRFGHTGDLFHDLGVLAGGNADFDLLGHQRCRHKREGRGQGRNA